MVAVEADAKRFLVEWYGSQSCATSIGETADRLNSRATDLASNGKQVRLLTAMAVPTDDYAFGVFAAESAELVAQVCHDAGAPPERISAAVGWVSP
ncbi:hypothetical protein ACKUT9_25750 [Mycobacterium seoulense]|nr:hypothetical protein [Mycobacterium seoulense]MCV7440601.1 hypothetical protein [Mycobacterium seoulense]